METVASKIPSKWKRVGVSLGIDQSKLDAIHTHRLAEPLECFSDVFTHWESNPQSPTTWNTLISVLRSDYVGERRLSDTIESMSALYRDIYLTFCTQSCFGESRLNHAGSANPRTYVG